MKMKKAFIIGIFASLMLTPFNAFSQYSITGIVYEDLNKNGIKDPDEKGVPEVPVSNGSQVELTNASGEYKIGLNEDNIIFVIKPSGYTFNCNENNQPEFYYVHKMNGSPELKYKGIPATGKVPQSVDFPLISKPYTENFRILVFGDPQPYTLEEMGFFRQAVVSELLEVQGVAFGISLGDLVGDDLDLFAPYKETVRQIGIPWHNVIGNHDINYDAKEEKYSDETFEKEFGPANYSFNYGMVHFIILDDILYPDPLDGKGYRGGLREDQFEFIENDLKYVSRDHLIVLSFHIPIRNEGHYESFRNEDRLRLFHLLKDFPHTLSLSAHTHYQRQDFFSGEDGWLQDKPHHQYNVGTTSGDWYRGKLDKNGIPDSTMRDGTPRGYAFLSFKKNEYVIDYKVAGKPEDYRMRIHAPRIVKQVKNTTAAVLVNFFTGGEFDTLYCRVDNGEWKEMYRYSTMDPVYYNKVLEWDFTLEPFEGKRPSYPVECDHLWYWGLPSDLAVGKHSISVKAVDMFGRTFIRKSSYKIVNEK